MLFQINFAKLSLMNFAYQGNDHCQLSESQAGAGRQNDAAPTVAENAVMYASASLTGFMNQKSPQHGGMPTVSAHCIAAADPVARLDLVNLKLMARTRIYPACGRVIPSHGRGTQASPGQRHPSPGPGPPAGNRVPGITDGPALRGICITGM